MVNVNRIPLVFISAFCLLFASNSLAYERNTARPVEKVAFGTVDSVRNISQKEIIQSQDQGWKTLAGAVIGGLIGNQFGSGDGRVVATVVGTVAGAGLGAYSGSGQIEREYKLVELLIKTEGKQLINVIQDYDRGMVFSPKDPVRILYFSDGVRVDKTY